MMPMPLPELPPLPTKPVKFRFLREHLKWVVLGCLFLLSCIDPLQKWYVRNFGSTEVVVVNDSGKAISNMNVSLPPQSLYFGELEPFVIAVKYVPHVVDTHNWRPDQSGTLSNGTRIVGNNGILAEEGAFLPRIVYIVGRDGTVDGGRWQD